MLPPGVGACLLRVRLPGVSLYIETGGERASRTRENNYSYFGVGVDRIKSLPELGQQLGI